MKTNKLIVSILICSSILLTYYLGSENQKTGIVLDSFSEKYDNYIEKYDKPSKILDALENNYSYLGSESVTNLAFELEDSQIKYLSYYNDKIFYDDNHRKIYKYFENGFSKEKIELIDDIKFKNLIDEILSSNYTLKKINEAYEVVIDYDSYKKFYGSMNTEGRSYFYIKKREVEEPYTLNGEFNIDLYELGDRIVETDDFILKYPFSKRINEMLVLNTSRVWSILLGEEKSKIIDEDSKVKGNYRTLYRYISSRISNKGFHKFLVGYIDLLEKQEYRFDEIASNYIYTYDDFYNYDIPMYDNDRVIIEYLDGKRMGGDYNYPKIVGYSNKKSEEEFNKRLLEIVEERITYDKFHGYYIGKIEFWSNYVLSYNKNGVICFNIFIDYTYKEKDQVDYITRALTIDLESGKILKLDDILTNLEKEKSIIISRVNDYLEYSDYKKMIDISEFNRLSEFKYVLNNSSVDLLYDVYNDDNHVVQTIKIPISFDGLTVRYLK